MRAESEAVKQNAWPDAASRLASGRSEVLFDAPPHQRAEVEGQQLNAAGGQRLRFGAAGSDDHRQLAGRDGLLEGGVDQFLALGVDAGPAVVLAAQRQR